MDERNKIKSVLKSLASMPLFMDKQAGVNLLLRYSSVMDSGLLKSEALIKEHQEKMKNLSAISFYNAENVFTGKFGSNFEGVQKGSIAVVPVMGAMMRDTYCTLSDGYISGTRDLERTVETLDANESVDGIVFYINTPGGQASGNESLDRKIQSCKTPTVGFFEMMASAGVGSFQGVDELYAAEKGSLWGSIGTYVTFADDSKFWENMGIDFIEIYAEQSTEKNIEYREALKGNEQPMLESLTKMTTSFIKQVKKARPSIQDDGLVFKGKIYTAEEAKKIGAIDGIKDLNFAISRARALSKSGKRKKKSNAAKNQTEDMSENKDTPFAIFKEKYFGKSSAKEAEEGMDKIQADMKSMEGKNTSLANQLKASEASLEESKNSNTELEAQLKVANSANVKLTEEKKVIEGSINTALESAKEINAELSDIQGLAADYKKVFAHNVELGALKKAATPIDLTPSGHDRNNSLGNEPLTTKQRTDAIMAEVDAELELKKEEK